MRYSIDTIIILAVLCCGIGIRGIVSLSSYSGASTPPMYGDYEAQRHWQEITYNLPKNMWYLNGSNNDLLYWGLDYPPLTAYHSFALGMVAHRINSSYVELFQSRGYESPEHKSFMRLTVLISDILIYIPSTALVMTSLKQFISKEYILSSLLLLVLHPGQILIDNGHFQYNNMSLGLFLFSVACIIKNRHNWGSFFFSLALNYKQMELYHAFPFFVYLLKASFSHKSFLKKLGGLMQVGFTTMITFLLLWTPWISSLETLQSTVHRLFPLNRGVFEDKVANIWCSLNVIYKLKENFQNNQMALICLVATLLAILPTNIHLFSNFKKKIFLFALLNTSISFFLLSYQVHEKSILLPTIPATLLFKAMPLTVLNFLKLSMLSIFPLLIKDNLYIPYFCMLILYLILFKYIIQLDYANQSYIIKIFIDILDISILIISITALYVSPPKRFPHIWSFIISFICCIFFIIFLLISNFMQYFLKIN